MAPLRCDGVRLAAAFLLALLLASGCLSSRPPVAAAPECRLSEVFADVPGLYDHLKAQGAEGADFGNPGGAPIDLHGVDPTLGNTTVALLRWHADGREWNASGDGRVGVRMDANGTGQASGDTGPTFDVTLSDDGLDAYTESYGPGDGEQMRSDFLRLLSLVADVEPAEAARAADRLAEPLPAESPSHHRAHAGVLSWKVDALWRSYTHATPDRVWDFLSAGPWQFTFAFERATAGGEGWTLRVDERGDLRYMLISREHPSRSDVLQRLNATVQSWGYAEPLPRPSSVEQLDHPSYCESLTPSPPLAWP